MFGDRNRNVQSNQSKSASAQNKTNVGVVYHVILDETDSIIKDFGIPTEQIPKYIGAIQYRLQTSSAKSDDLLSLALPANQNYNSLPTKNEVVRIINGEGGGMFYERISKSVTPNVNTSNTTISDTFIKDKNQNNKPANYSKVQQTGIARSNFDSSADYDSYGSYFEFTPNIHHLKLYEGDTIIESRFGQSIRLSGYNNSENTFSPTLIIRNGESGESSQKGVDSSTEEDINKDGGIIAFGSNQYKLPFQPGVVSDGGSSNFETSPASFKDYPSELLGNQILLNSDRLIFSAKTSEMIFYSKGNYGFISDGQLSIDNKFGIEVNVNDDINITTNDRSVNVNSGNGNINLGNQNLESLVRGETLVDLLTQLIDAIEAQIFLTPSGPTATGPTNIATFSKIKSELKTALSNLNKTS